MLCSSTVHGTIARPIAGAAKCKLARSEFGSDYVLCIEGRCRPLADVAPGAIAATTLRSCAAADLAVSAP